MEDKEIGELWRYRDHFEDCDTIEALIRKLVEGRVLYYEDTSRETRIAGPYLERALLDFGIEPEEFNR